MNFSILMQPWPWYVAGPAIAFVMFSLLYFGKSFGVSSNLRTICSILGAGKNCDFFEFKWRDQIWNLVFALGMILGGFIASNYLTDPEALVNLSRVTKVELEQFGIVTPGKGLVPLEVFSLDQVLTTRGFVMMILGGFLVGFGTRYAGGCTSGHAISGLSDLQMPSLIAVIGFFIGGLFMTYFVLPTLLTL